MSSIVSLYVANPDGQNSNSIQFTIADAPAPAPSIVSIAPELVLSGATIVLNGSNFVSGAVVKFGTTLGTNAVVSATQISVTVPQLSPGTVSVTVQNADSLVSNAVSITIDTVPVPAPTITSLSPTSGFAGSTLTVTGTGFASGAIVKFGTTSATNIVVVSSTQITATVPALSAGVFSVVVQNSDGQVSASRSFTITTPPPPTITSVNPTSGPPGTVVTITGTGFVNGAVARFGSSSGTNITVVSPTEITVIVPSSVGSTLLTVQTPSGSQSIAFAVISGIPSPFCQMIDGKLHCWDLNTNSWQVWEDKSLIPQETSQDVITTKIVILERLLLSYSDEIRSLKSRIAEVESNQLNKDLAIAIIKAQQTNIEIGWR
jgi:hypothetical protein